MALKRCDERAELTTTNTGAGIAREILPRVFERFYQGDPATAARWKDAVSA